MLLRFADHHDPNSWASRLRRKRVAILARVLAEFSQPVRVLDVGGTAAFWRTNGTELPCGVRLTVMNRTSESNAENDAASAGEEDPSASLLCDLEFVVGDARDLSTYDDRHFDVCFSNSVIEHVGTLYDQQNAAQEMRRVARAYVVQTPNHLFPLEPHFHVPGWQYMPFALRAHLHRRFTLGWMTKEPDHVLARADVEQVRLLVRSEMQALFPEATIVREMLGPIAKSFIAAYHPSIADFPSTI